MGENEVSKISEGLRKIGIGGITAFKAKGRGKTVPESIHASLGTEIYTPEFSDKYVVLLVLPDTKFILSKRAISSEYHLHHER